MGFGLVPHMYCQDDSVVTKENLPSRASKEATLSMGNYCVILNLHNTWSLKQSRS